MEKGNRQQITELISDTIIKLDDIGVELGDCLGFCACVAATAIKSAMTEEEWPEGVRKLFNYTIAVLKSMKEEMYEVAGIDEDGEDGLQ